MKFFQLSGVLTPTGRTSMRNLLFLLPISLLFLFGFVAPLWNIVKFSFAEEFVQGRALGLSLSSFAEILKTPFYLQLTGNTLLYAAITTVVSIILAYPLSLVAIRGPKPLRVFFLTLIMLPLLTSVVVKSFGWSVLLASNGPVQNFFDRLGVDVHLMFTPAGVVVGLVHTYMPFMAMSLMAALQRADVRLVDAAASLGAGRIRRFFTVTLPQTLEGLSAGITLTFVTSMSALVTPQLLGGGKVQTIATVIYEQSTLNRSLVSALGVLLLALTVIIVLLQGMVVKYIARR